MSRIILITGTDTGVGKTAVSAALLRALRAEGHHPFPIKPVETGCADLALPEDGIALSVAAGGVPLDLVCPFRYRLPAAPATAARLEGARHTFQGVLEHIRRIEATHRLVIVEGAGGLLVPLSDDKTFADLARAVGASLVVVARDALGTLNHTSLTLEAASSRGVPVLAVVLNAVAIPDAVFVDHGAELRSLWPGVPVLGPIPRRRDVHSISNEEAIARLSIMITDI